MITEANLIIKADILNNDAGKMARELLFARRVIKYAREVDGFAEGLKPEQAYPELFDAIKKYDEAMQKMERK